VLFIVPLNQVHHNAATLEQIDHLAIGELVRDRGDATVGVDGEKLGRFLLVGGEGELLDVVREAMSRDVSDEFSIERSSRRVDGTKIAWTQFEKMRYAYPSSSSRMEILMPFGVCAV